MLCNTNDWFLYDMYLRAEKADNKLIHWADTVDLEQVFITGLGNHCVDVLQGRRHDFQSEGA